MGNPQWVVSSAPFCSLTDKNTYYIYSTLLIEVEDLIFTSFLSCGSHLTSFIFSFLTGKTKSIVKNDKLVKKKLPDYKVAYVILVGFLISPLNLSCVVVVLVTDDGI